jgi:hypothetical protein
MSTELRQSQTEPDVIAWRRDQLVNSGFPLPVASRVAHDRHFDLHALIDLAERGCPPSLAVRILAPLEDNSDTR